MQVLPDAVRLARNLSADRYDDRVLRATSRAARPLLGRNKFQVDDALLNDRALLHQCPTPREATIDRESKILLKSHATIVGQTDACCSGRAILKSFRHRLKISHPAQYAFDRMAPSQKAPLVQHAEQSGGEKIDVISVSRNRYHVAGIVVPADVMIPRRRKAPVGDGDSLGDIGSYSQSIYLTTMLSTVIDNDGIPIALKLLDVHYLAERADQGVSSVTATPTRPMSPLW